MKKHSLPFQFSPSLITLLGEQLIHDKKIALSELVKNAYDADASFIEIHINSNSNEIALLDDGCGMDLETIKNIWLKPGVSEKKQAIKERELTPKYHRLPIGEKGVGRLGVHKLGKRIELYSIYEGAKPIYFSIDWQIIEKAQSFDELDDVIVQELDLTPSEIRSKTGTFIKINDLKESWKGKDTDACIKDLMQVISPFSIKNNFDIRVFRDNQRFPNHLKEQVSQIKDRSLYQFKIVMNNGLLKEFDYYFKPWKSINKISTRKITLNEDKKFIDKLIASQNLQEVLFLTEQSNELETNDGIGEICFKGFIYDFDNELLKQEFAPKEKQLVKEYMKNSGGIRVYRDGMRVYNYGDAGFDILELDLKRVNRPAGKISSNQIAAMIELKRGESEGLIEKTNREGFIHNQAFKQLLKYLEAAMDLISVLRQRDKGKINATYLNKITKADINQRLLKLNGIIEKSNLEDRQKHKITKELTTFTKEIDHLKDVLLTASNTGLNMTIIVHELDKIVDHLEKTIQKKNFEQINKVFHHLKNTLDIYKKTIRLDKTKSLISVSNLIKQVGFNSDYRFKAHNIEYIADIEENLSFVGKQGLIIGIFTNLFDNAIYWLETYRIENKKIYVRAYQEEEHLFFVIADNGKGFVIDFETALEAFVCGRKEETSMGIGLFVSEQIMLAHEGTINHGDWQEEGLSEEFSEGAIIKLKFKKG